MSTTRQIVGGVTIALVIVAVSAVSSAGKIFLFPGFGIAMMLGGSFDEPGYLSEKTTVMVMFAGSFVVWMVVAIFVLRMFSKRAGA